MNPQWRSFLEEHGARIQGDEVTAFGASAADEAPEAFPAMADLSHFSLLEFRGADAGTFLHGQLSSDLAVLSPGNVQFSSWCNAKGRVISVLAVLRGVESFWALLPGALAAGVAQRMTRYVLRADVRIIDQSELLPRFGQFAVPPQEIPAPGSEMGEIHSFLLPGSGGRRLNWGNPEAVVSAWDGLSADMRPAGAAAWRRADLADRVPWVFSQTSEQYLPQELELESLGGLSYEKGCYPGQEVIARVHYRGRAPGILCRIRGTGLTGHVDPGTGIASADGANAGTVLYAQRDPDGTFLALAVLDRKQTASAGLRLSGSGAAVTDFAPAVDGAAW